MRFPLLSPPARGFTLPEAAVTLAVAAVFAALAWPPVTALTDRWRLDAAATALANDLAFARTEAVVRQEPVRLSVLPQRDGGACHVVHTGPAAECTCDTRCSGAAHWLRQTDHPAASRLQLDTHTASLQFDPQLGTCTPTGTLALHSASGAAVHVVVNVMGRVRTCSPGTKVGRHVPC